jgi:hypothetical protein
MKKIIILLLVALSFQSQAQIFKSRYEKDIAKALIAADAALDTFDFTIPPIERVPQKVQGLSIQAVTNWSKDLLLPADVVKLMQDSCKYRGVLKIMDTGSRQTHVDLQYSQLPGSNYTTDSGLNDGNGHGTHVSGICVAKDFGLLWPLIQKGLVEWKPVQVLTAGGSGNFSWITNAVNGEFQSDQAFISSGKFVVYNASLGGGTSILPDTENAFKKSYNIGVNFVFAAGNTGQPGVQYPGKSLYGIATGSLNSNLTLSSFSSTGPEIVAAMPGGGINSTYKNNTYAVLSGTSMASPANASAVFIARSRWGPQLANSDKLKAYMKWVATDLPPTGRDDQTGWGIEYIRNILTKSPAGMGPVIPAPPPPTDTIPVKSLRTLTFNIEKDYSILWGTSATAKAKSRQMSKSQIKSTAYQSIKITDLVVSYQSKTDAVNSEKLVKSAVEWFFASRGLQLLPGSDENDALYYTAFFLKLLCKSEKKVDLQVLKIGTDSGLYIENPK